MYSLYPKTTIYSGNTIKCPFSDGAIVYQAREFMNMLSKEHIEYEDICPGDNRNHEAEAETANEPSGNFRIYPNPNTGYFVLENLIEATDLVMDMTGRIVAKIKLREGMNEIDLREVGTGVYFYHVYTTETLVANGKIEVIK